MILLWGITEKEDGELQWKNCGEKEGPEGDSYYAYGWVRTKSSRGTDVITHNGGNPYIQNDMYIYPEEKIIVYITSNNGQFSAIDQSGNILRLLFNIR